MAKKVNITSDQRAELNRLRKYANRQLTNIETIYTEKGYGEMKQFAYRDAIRDIEHIYGKGKTRFSIPRGRITYRQYQMLKSSMERFLSKPSSNLRRLKITYAKRSETIRKKYGVELSWKDMGKFFESGMWSTLSTLYGSKTAMKTFKYLNNYKGNVNKMERYSRRDVRNKVEFKLALQFAKDNQELIQSYYDSL